MAQQERRRPTRNRRTKTIPESTVEQPKTEATAPTVTRSVVASGCSREADPSSPDESPAAKANESENPPEKGPSKTSGPRVRKPQTECPAIDYDSVVLLGSWDVEYKAAAIGRYAKEVARLLEDGVGVARTAGSEVDLLRGAILDALPQAACQGKDAPLKRGQIWRCYEAILKLMGSDGTFRKSGSAEGLKRLADRLEDLAAMPDPASIELIAREMRRLAQGGWTNHDHVLLRSAASLYVLLAARGNLGIDPIVRKAMTSLEHLNLGRHNDEPDLGDLVEAAEALQRAHCEKTINEVLADQDVKSLPARLRRLLQIVDFQQLGSDTRDRLASIHMTMAGLWWPLHEARDRGPIEIWTDLKQKGFDLELLSDLESGQRRLDRIVEGQGTADDRRALLMLADILDPLMNAQPVKHVIQEMIAVPEDSGGLHKDKKGSGQTSQDPESNSKSTQANCRERNTKEGSSPDMTRERSERILGPIFEKAFEYREHWRGRVRDAVGSLTSWIEQSEKGRYSSVAPFPYMEPDVRKPAARDLPWMYIVVGLKLEDFIHTQDVFIPEESAWELRYRSRWIQVSVFNMVRRWPSLTEWQAWWRFIEADLPTGKTPDTQSPFSPQELALLTEWKQFSEKCHQSGKRPTVEKFCQNRRMSNDEKDDFRRLKDKARKHAK